MSNDEFRNMFLQYLPYVLGIAGLIGAALNYIFTWRSRAGKADKEEKKTESDSRKAEAEAYSLLVSTIASMDKGMTSLRQEMNEQRTLCQDRIEALEKELRDVRHQLEQAQQALASRMEAAEKAINGSIDNEDKGP